MTDILGGLRKAGYEPVVVEDTTSFAPVKGSYICRIDSAGRLIGNSKKSGEPYDFRVIKPQVVEVIEGDNALNRFLDLRPYTVDDVGTKKLLNDLHTAGIEVSAQTDEELDSFLSTLVDKTMNIKAWIAPKMKKEGDEWVKVEPREDVQRVKIVNKFKGKTDKSDVKVPF